MRPNRSGSKKTYTKAWNFINYGNLFFYNEKEFNDKFFYFNLLLDKYERRPPNKKYLQMKHNIGYEARSQLNNTHFITKRGNEELDFNMALDQILIILNNAILYERNNEIKYISEQKSKFEEAYKGVETEESKQIKEAFNEFEFLINKAKIDESDSIDYIKLINLINYILQGKKNTKALIDFEAEHLNEIDKRMNEIHNAYERQIRGFGIAKLDLRGEELSNFVENSVKRHKQKIRQTYAITPDFREKGGGLKKGFSRLKNLTTSEAKISKWITETIKKILNNEDILLKIKQILQNNPPNINLDSSKMYGSAELAIRELIIKSVTDYAKDHMSEILAGVVNQKTLDELTDNLINSYSGVLEYNITGWWKNFGIVGQQDIPFFRDYINNTNGRIASAKSFTDTIEKLIKRITAINKKNQEITEDEKKLAQFFGIMDQNGKLSTDSDMYKLLQMVGELEKARQKMEKEKKDSIKTKIPKDILTPEDKEENIVIEFELVEGELMLSERSEQLLRGKKISDTHTLNDFLPKTFKNFKMLVANLKRNVSIKLRDLFLQSISDKNVSNQTLEKLRNALLPVKIQVSSSVFSEVVQTLQQQSQQGVESIWSGNLEVKNDVITIQVDAPIESFTINLNNEIKNITESQINEVNSIFSTEYTEINKTLTSTIYNQLQEVRKDKSFTDYERMAQQFFTLSEERDKALKKADEELARAVEIIRNGKGLIEKREELVKELEEKRSKFLEQFKNSLYISSTMKNYSAYQNDVGFTGGDLGPNLSAQLGTIKLLYEKAGFTFPEETYRWIYSATINCSRQSVVGEKHKDQLETFLGSLVIFSLFNEGGAEIQIVKDGVEKALNDSNMKIMHLYRLNGLYYPGSFVLTKVIENINNMRKIMNNVNKLYTPNNIMIVNNINPHDLPNKNIDFKNKNYMSKLNKKPWEEVSKTAEKKVSLKVVFMAGLLEIVKQLQNAANDIQLPT